MALKNQFSVISFSMKVGHNAQTTALPSEFGFWQKVLQSRVTFTLCALCLTHYYTLYEAVSKPGF